VNFTKLPDPLRQKWLSGKHAEKTRHFVTDINFIDQVARLT
jgi:hypothetical protein